MNLVRNLPGFMRLAKFVRRSLMGMAVLAPQAFAAGLPAEDAVALLDAYPLAGHVSANSVERIMLLGEKERQLGTLTLRIDGHSELVLDEVSRDAARKGWSMVSSSRQGLDFSLTFSKQDRTLNLRGQQVDNGLLVLSYTVIPSQRQIRDPQTLLPERRK